jgi:hypothetical protein
VIKESKRERERESMRGAGSGSGSGQSRTGRDLPENDDQQQKVWQSTRESESVVGC